MTPFQGVTRYAQQLQRIFSLKGGDAVTVLAPQVVATHPVTDVNAGELQLLKGHVLNCSGLWLATLAATGGTIIYYFNPAGSGKVVVLTSLSIFLDGTSTAADSVGFAVLQPQQGPPGHTPEGTANTLDSRLNVVSANTFSVLQQQAVATSGLPPTAPVAAVKLRVMPAGAQIQDTLTFTQPIILFPNSFCQTMITKLATNFLAVSYGSFNATGYERSFEPSENVTAVGTAL